MGSNQVGFGFVTVYYLHDHCSLIYTVSCSPPSVPRNGFLDELTSTTIMFGCNEGYSPQGTMTAECVATDTWSPDPAQLECTSTTTTSGMP